MKLFWKKVVLREERISDLLCIRRDIIDFETLVIQMNMSEEKVINKLSEKKLPCKEISVKNIF